MMCRLYRWKMSFSKDLGGGLGELSRRHLLQCEPCRDYWRQLNVLENRLRIEAGDVAPFALPAGRGRGVVRRLHLGFVAPALAAAAVIVIALCLNTGFDPAPMPVGPIVADSAAGPAALAVWLDDQGQDAYAREAQLLAQHAMDAVGVIVSRVSLPAPRAEQAADGGA